MEGDWRKIKPSVGQALSHLLETGLYTDVSFKVGSTKHTFNAHKVVIMARSEVFAVMLQDRWDETNKKGERTTIDIPDATPNAFEHFIKYLYTDWLTCAQMFLVSEILQVLHLAHMYQVPGLISKCSKMLSSGINLDNCVQIYQGTRLYQDERINLSHASFKFLTKNLSKIVDKPEFLHLDKEGLTELLQSDNLVIDETALFKAILKWSNQEEKSEEIKQGRKAVLKSLIPLIRFPLMGAESFAKEVVPTKLLTDAETIQMFLYFSGGNAKPIRFITTPRIGTKSNTKLRQVECFESQSTRRYPIHGQVHISENLFGYRSTGQNNPSKIYFTCDQEITIHGIELFGLVANSNTNLLFTYGRSGSSLDFFVQIDISNYNEQNIWRTCSKITTSEFDQFLIFLDQPLKLRAKQFYSVAATLETEPTQFQRVEFRYGILNMTQKCSDGTTFTFKGMSGDTLTIIKSITFTNTPLSGLLESRAT